MKISIIGTVMRDEIHTCDGKHRESFGGILYNILAFANLTRSTDVICPVCCVGSDHLKKIKSEYFDSLKQIRLSGVVESPEGSDENVLRYQSDSDREEQMTLRTPPLNDDQIADVLDSSAILVNIINGYEIDLAGLRLIREKSKAHIHLDIHNLGKRIDSDGKLVPEGIPNWREWLAQVDSVQANEWEMEATDTTGCGDCFSSAFIVGMLRYQNPTRALLMATTLSSLNAKGKGIDGLSTHAKRLDKNAQIHYPELWRQSIEDWFGEIVNDDELKKAAQD